MLEDLLIITQAMAHRFPEGNDPFQIMTRLLEECGELAQQVNHFEGSGVKREKYGEPNREKMAKEVKDCLISVLQIVRHYGIQQEVEETLAVSYRRLLSEGHIQNPSQNERSPE